MSERLYKGFDLSFKDVDVKQGIVTGYFAAFDSKDSDGDIIERGSFVKTIQERGPQGKQLIKWLLDHDKYKAIGKLTELREDSFGLYYEGKVGRHSLGKDFMLMVEDGIINQHSFGYKIIKEQYDKNLGANKIKELMMFEGSPIQFLGANQNTPIVGIKCLDDAIQMCEKLNKFINASKATDETLQQLEEKLKSLLLNIEPLLHSNSTEPTDEQIKQAIIKAFDNGR
jgi:hypothetical protein